MRHESKSTESETHLASKPSPKHIVLDTNVLLRLVILDFGTREAIGIPALAKKAGTLVVLAPGQEDEFWRNASDVLGEHTKRWAQIARDIKRDIADLVTNLKAAASLGILEKEREQVLADICSAKNHLDKVKERSVKWQEFEEFAEKNFVVLRAMTKEAEYDSNQIRERAEERVAMSNPPCREKKSRPLGDCLVWEVVLTMLERKTGECWFATTDADFSDRDDVHSLNRLLEREVRKSGGTLRFLHEDRNLGLSPGPRFKVLTELAQTISQYVTKRMRIALDSLSLISPVVSWLQVEEALGQLPYRDREILKLRLGIGDGYNYTQNEVSQVFGLSQPRISQIERSAAEKLIKLLGSGTQSSDE
jgi:hypothetical protein